MNVNTRHYVDVPTNFDTAMWKRCYALNPVYMIFDARAHTVRMYYAGSDSANQAARFVADAREQRARLEALAREAADMVLLTGRWYGGNVARATGRAYVSECVEVAA